jgi:hypothetical protein
LAPELEKQGPATHFQQLRKTPGLQPRTFDPAPTLVRKDTCAPPFIDGESKQVENFWLVVNNNLLESLLGIERKSQKIRKLL